MCGLFWHSLLGLASRGLSSGSSNRFFIEFLHCLFCYFGQLSLTLGPFSRKFLTSSDARGISNLAWCQWRSSAWRVYIEFLHVLGSHISILPPFSGPSPLYFLNAHFALILRLFSMNCLIWSAIPCIDVFRDFKCSVVLQLLSSLLRFLSFNHFLQLGILNS